jgi:hypothetical protein
MKEMYEPDGKPAEKILSSMNSKKKAYKTILFPVC